MKLSFVVPTIDSLKMATCMASFRYKSHPGCEIIVVNQTAYPLPPEITEGCLVALRELVLDSPIPASDARNRGAELAKGEYVMFLDDDAFVFQPADWIDHVLAVLEDDPALAVCNRGYMKDGIFVSDWPRKKFNLSNFPRYTIEWNCIFRTSVFRELNGFPPVGPGSSHRAWCGESFLLVGKILALGHRPALLEQVRIAHPNLDAFRSVTAMRSYKYGSAYCAGRFAREQGMARKLYWVGRAVASGLRNAVTPVVIVQDFGHRGLRNHPQYIAFKEACLGFMDGFSGRSPRCLTDPSAA